MYFYYIFDTDLGRILIAENGEAITHLGFAGTGENINKDWNQEETALLREANCQLNEYLDGKRTIFTVPVEPKGTEFQEKVWKALVEIPYGEVRSYGQIAQAVGSPKASRAVGMANHRNPVMIIVPCHRVIGSNGALVGYGGGIDVKKKLLDLESKQ